MTEAFDPDTPWWLQGNFAPVTQEVEAFDLTVTGELPAALTGLYARNGSNARPGRQRPLVPGRRDAPRRPPRRGPGLLVPQPLDPHRPLRVGRGVRRRRPPGGEPTYSNVSAFTHAGRLLTSGEIGYPYELSPDDLSTVGVHDFDGRLTTSMTAHPKIDPDTGFLHFFGYGFAEPYLTYHVADERGRLISSQEVAVAGPTMIHDFAITDQDVVFWEFPVVFDLDLAIAGEGMPFRWEPSYGARIGVLPLGGPDVEARWVEVDPAYVFHGINAYRSGDDVIVDVSQFATMFDGGRARPGGRHPPLDDRHRRRRAHLPRRRARGRPPDGAADPRPPQGRAGSTGTAGWSSPRPTPTRSASAGSTAWTSPPPRPSTGTPGPGRAANEGLFVPNPDGTDEDDGWVLTYVYDAATERSELAVLDGSDLRRGPVGDCGAARPGPAWVPCGLGPGTLKPSEATGADMGKRADRAKAKAEELADDAVDGPAVRRPHRGRRGRGGPGQGQAQHEEGAPPCRRHRRQGREEDRQDAAQDRPQGQEDPQEGPEADRQDHQEADLTVPPSDPVRSPRPR